MSFNLDEYRARVDYICDKAEEKMGYSSDEEHIHVGIVGIQSLDGQNISDFQYCCGFHLMATIALLKSTAEQILVENETVPEWELEELWERAQEAGDIDKFSRQPLSDDEDIGSWLDNGEL